MPHKDIAEALAGAMREDGCELDCTDRLIIRQTLYRALTAQRRRADHERSDGLNPSIPAAYSGTGGTGQN